MLKSVKLENEFNEVLELVGNRNYSLTNIEGLNPPQSTINSSSNGIYDGSRYDSSRVGDRNIVLTIAIENPVERNRIDLYKYARPKRYIKFHYANGIRDVYIEGYVETFEVNPFSQKLVAQISIICTQPYFYDVNVQSVVFRDAVSLFEFPFTNPVEGMAFSEILTKQIKTVSNMGDTECGMIFEVEAYGNIVEPAIRNVDTGEKFVMNLEMLAGDKMVINTRDRAKSVTLERNGVVSNVINRMTQDSVWLKAPIGIDKFTYDTVFGAENMQLTIYQTNLYLGV